MVCRLVHITRVQFLGIVLHPWAPNNAGTLTLRCPIPGEHAVSIIAIIIIEHVPGFQELSLQHSFIQQTFIKYLSSVHVLGQETE